MRYKSLAACGPILLKDEKVPPAERADLAIQFDDLAVGYLQFGAQTGYLKDSANLEQLQTDKAFDALRTRDDFKRLLNQPES